MIAWSWRANSREMAGQEQMGLEAAAPGWFGSDVSEIVTMNPALVQPVHATLGIRGARS
jgi:hypothetical protein